MKPTKKAKTVSSDSPDLKVVSSQKKPEYSPNRQWTEKLVEKGWIPVSRIFLRYYSRLTPNITHGEAMLIIHLMDFKWGAKAPFPTYQRLSEYMGISKKMVQIHAKNLEIKGYLKRQVRPDKPNKFHLQKLFAALEAYFSKIKEKQNEEEAELAEEAAIMKELA